MEKLKELIRKSNELGLPLPLLRDCRTGKASVTMTMMIISFNVTIFGLIGKITKIIGDVDNTSAMSLFVATSALYLGRKLQKDDKNVTVDSPQEGKNE